MLYLSQMICFLFFWQLLILPDHRRETLPTESEVLPITRRVYKEFTEGQSWPLFQEKIKTTSAVFAKICRSQFRLESEILLREFLKYIYIYEKSSREYFALRSKLWPANIGKHRHKYAGNSRSSGIFNFGQAKHCKKGPVASFRPKGVCSLMCTGLFTFCGAP